MQIVPSKVYVYYDYGIITDMEQTPSSLTHSPELPSVSSPSTREKVGAFSSVEAITGVATERHEGVPAAEQAVAPPPIVLPAPMPLTDDAGTTATPVVNDNPSVASDDELIEKEWVDKAKKVIAETKDDPYRREQEVSRLQADYLSKRYGRELGSLQ